MSFFFNFGKLVACYVFTCRRSSQRFRVLSLFKTWNRHKGSGEMKGIAVVDSANTDIEGEIECQ